MWKDFFMMLGGMVKTIGVARTRSDGQIKCAGMNVMGGNIKGGHFMV